MSNLIILNNNYKEKGCLERVLNYCLRTSLFKPMAAGVDAKVIWHGCGVDTTSFNRMIRSFEYIQGLSSYVHKKLHHFVITIYLPYDYENQYDVKRTSKKKRGFEESLATLISLQLSNYLCYELGFQNVYIIHYDKQHVHIHFIMNSVNYMTGKGISNERTFYSQILNYCKVNFKETPWEGYLSYKKGDEPYEV